MASLDRTLRAIFKSFGGLVMLVSIFGISDFAFASDEAEKAEIECKMWQSHIKSGQTLTEDMQANVHIVPPNGAVIADYEAGRRTIWMGPNNKVKYATCG